VRLEKDYDDIRKPSQKCGGFNLKQKINGS
jgi:hypothetical protein